MSQPADRLPPLPLAAWEPTKNTLHLWTQIVGKIRLAATPPRNHWWHVPLYVDVRGMTTRRLHAPSGITFEIAFDFVDHRLVVLTDSGAGRVVRARTTGSRSPSSTSSCTAILGDARRRRGDPRAPVRRADDDAVPGGPRARRVRPGRGRAILADPRLDRRGVRGVRRLVLRQDEPGPPLLALVRSRRDPLRRRAGTGDSRCRSGHRRGLFARGRLVRVLGGRRQRTRAHLLLLHRA